ncbi:MAG: chondroitinase family polysaccharide lyase [Bacteroidales bacterium]
MNRKLAFSYLLLASLSTGATKAQNYFEVVHPEIFSFESSPEPVSGDAFSSITLSQEHYKHQLHSLRWKWSAPNACLTISRPIPYLTKNPNPKEASVSTFLFWAYLKSPVKDGKLRFEFLKEGRLCSWFEYGLDFKGWHGAWVAFDRDMQGKPEEGMDEIRIIAPNTPEGEIFLDHIVPSSFQDVRQHTAGFQSPFINPNTNSHWLQLLKHWDYKLDIPVGSTLTDAERKDLQDVDNRLHNLLRTGKKTPVAQIRKRFKDYGIEQNPDGTIKGKSIFFLRYAESYYNLGGPRSTKWYGKDNRAFKQACDFLYLIANTYHETTNAAEKEELAQMYLQLTQHLSDQGFVAGSEMGTLHHLGYSSRNFFFAHYLMKDVLRRANMDEDVQKAMEWFSGTGEVKLKPKQLGMDIDAFNTYLVGRLASIMMLRDTPEKAAYLKAFSRWADNGYKYTDGTGACFKVDGSVFHHRINYPAYAVGGFDGAVECIWLLHNTSFAISEESHENLKKALLLMRTYCNKTNWPLSLSGRHPDGKGKLHTWHYGRLALVGSPDKSEKIDTQLAAAYLRLTSEAANDEYNDVFKKANILPELSPNGNWSVNYSCLNIHRRDNWSATVMGHSRYLWASEIYLGCNHYGRYLNHGQLQILSQGDPITNFSNGFRQEGWDWNHFPGTTAAVFPIADLKADVRNLDDKSGYEEMLLSDEAYAGSLSQENKNGVFAMKLHEHDKYNGTLKANKSYFFFDNRIICLGSDIENNTPGHTAQTTLFQEYLPEEKTVIEVNGKVIQDFPFTKQLSGKFNYLADTRNNHYFVRHGEILVSKKLQHSLHEETDKPTQNNFALATINHGDQIKNGAYEYMILVDGKPNEVKKAIKKLPYQVLQKDKQAHIVNDRTTATTAYALFEAGKPAYGKQIAEVNIPALIMVKQEGKNQIRLSACDPDLRFYEGASDEVFDANNKRIERSVYSRNWINNPSGKSTLTITLNGTWSAAGNTDEWTITHKGKQTILSTECQHGLGKEIVLNK